MDGVASTVIRAPLKVNCGSSRLYVTALSMMGLETSRYVGQAFDMNTSRTSIGPPCDESHDQHLALHRSQSYQSSRDRCDKTLESRPRTQALLAGAVDASMDASMDAAKDGLPEK